MAIGAMILSKNPELGSIMIAVRIVARDLPNRAQGKRDRGSRLASLVVRVCT